VAPREARKASIRIVTVVLQVSSDTYKAHCPSLPGCAVLGRSRQEAAERLSHAAAGYLASFDAIVPGHIELQVLDHGQGTGGPAGANGTTGTRRGALAM